MIETASMLSRALGHARHGRAVIPLHSILPGGGCSCSRRDECRTPGKHPRYHPEELAEGILSATAEEGQVRRWWQRWPNSNIGIACGRKSGFWVLDIDPRHGGDETLAELEQQFGPLPLTVEQVTGGGGRHLLFLLPAGFEVRNIQRAAAEESPLGPGLDLRGEGGLIVAPGSLHASGGTYEWETEHHPDDVPIAEAPPWLLQRVKEAVSPMKGPAGPVGERIPVGKQHSTLVSLAGSMRARGMDEEEIAAALLVINRRRCERPGPEENIRRIAASVMRYTPKQAAAQAMEPPRADEEAPPERGARNGNGNGNGAAHLDAPAIDQEGEDPEAGDQEPEAQPEEEDRGASQFVLARDWAENVRERLAWFEGAQWWSYEGGVWSYSSGEVAEASVQRFITRRLPASKITPEKVRGVLFLARSMLGPHRVAELDAHPTWVPVANGVYDTETGRILTHSPDHFLTHRLSFAFDGQAECPRWLDFLREVILTRGGEPCEEWIETIQEWFGYCLVPDNSAQAAMFWIGGGRNGKGVATRVLEALVGPAQCTAVAIEQLHEPYHRAQLQGKLVGFVNEPDRRSMLKNASHFKAITGGDPIEARRPTEKVFSFTPVCRLIVSTNSMPSSRDDSFGYYRRVLIIEWRKQIERAKVDTALGDKLQRELPGILNWALEGLRRFRARGSRFAEIEESERLLNEYRIEEDPLEQYLADEMERVTGARVAFAAVYAGLRTYCKINGFPDPASTTRIGRALETKGFPSVTGRMPDGTAAKMRVGLQFRSGSPFAPRPDDQGEMFG